MNGHRSLLWAPAAELRRRRAQDHGAPGRRTAAAGGAVAVVAVFLLMTGGRLTAQTDDAAAEIYGVQCAGCHGANGEGGVGPSLVASTMTLDQVGAVIADGATGMPGYATSLDTAALDALSAYVLAFQASTPPATSATPPSSASGFYAVECAGCHGASGEGAVAGPLVSLPYSVDDLAAIIRNGVKNMPSFSGKLDPDQITALAVFVADLKPGAASAVTQPPVSGSQPTPTSGGDVGASDGPELYRLKCAACHGADAAGGIASSLIGTPLDEQGLIAVIETGVGAMPGFADSLDPDEIGEIATFIGGLGGQDPAPSGSDVVTSAVEDPSAAATPDPAESAGTGPTFWGPLLSTIAAFVVVTGLLSRNRRRMQMDLANDQQQEAAE